jgi:hypothetical protein
MFAEHTAVASLFVPRVPGSFHNYRFSVGAGMFIPKPQDMAVPVTGIPHRKDPVDKMGVKVTGDTVMRPRIPCFKLFSSGALVISCGQSKMHMAVNKRGKDGTVREICYLVGRWGSGGGKALNGGNQPVNNGQQS